MSAAVKKKSPVGDDAEEKVLSQTHHRKEQDRSEQKLQEVKTLEQEYLHLQKTLKDLPLKLTHDIMLPVGGTSLAFMAGKIFHTNEIMCLLGENIFVETTAHTCCEIVSSRLKNIREQLKLLEREKDLTKSWAECMESVLGDGDQNRVVEEEDGKDPLSVVGVGVEIKEEMTEEEWEAWKVKHRERQRLEVKKRKDVEGSVQPKTMPRKSSLTNSITSDAEGSKPKKKVSWADEQPNQSCFTVEDIWKRLDVLEKEEEEATGGGIPVFVVSGGSVPKTKVIKFRHFPSQQREAASVVHSINEKELNVSRKSLDVNGNNSMVRPQPQHGSKPTKPKNGSCGGKSPVADDLVVLSETVLEKKNPFSKEPTKDSRAISKRSSPGKVEAEGQRPVSRFKAARRQ